MNSFHTHDATVELIKKYKQHHIQIRCFEQSVFPRLRADTHEPLPTKAFSMDTKQNWCARGSAGLELHTRGTRTHAPRGRVWRLTHYRVPWARHPHPHPGTRPGTATCSTPWQRAG